MAAFPYEMFKRGWKRAGIDQSDDGMHLPLPIGHSSTDDPDSSRGRRSTRDDAGKQRFRLLDKGRAGKGIVRFGLPAGGWYLYWSDIFHTLLNMPRYRFLLVFFCVYLTEYLLFALLYLTLPDSCVGGVMKFSHAMWFSVQTAATLGYTGSLQPNPDCTAVNMLVLFQVITAALIDYCMMGLVFARFASPNKRSFTIRFSSAAVLFQRSEDGLWCLSFRLANIRKHSLINPQISLMFALPADAAGGTGRGTSDTGKGGGAAASGIAHFHFQELAIEDLASQAANLRLGVHAHINHVIRPGSPLFDRSLDELQSLGAEVLCFMEGVDPMTSNNIQARHSYTPADIRMNQRFVPIELKVRGRELGLDFSGFDSTSARALAAGGADEVRDGGFATFLVPVPGPAAGPASGTGAAATGQIGGDVEAGWSNGAVPLMPLAGGASAGADGIAASTAEVNTMMAVALSGDLRSHMQALRAQSIRSLTTPLVPLPQLVPSVASASAAVNGASQLSPAASDTALPHGLPISRAAHGGSRASSQSHPLSSPTGLTGLAAVAAAAGAVAGGGITVAPAAAALPRQDEMRDLCDAVLTDVGCSAAVKRQAVALKEALSAWELLPRGPAELAGRQL